MVQNIVQFIAIWKDIEGADTKTKKIDLMFWAGKLLNISNGNCENRRATLGTQIRGIF